ncbi:hypothetical protein D7X74_21820 [Corallococcus sp. CA047B]|uniref:hypothetical protein n=1 Tax=Corallococcus sp. CA047B TaxID=2316729 RepID=UPI000EA08409|nr:hypothetical protein [Corallococcus sp. CA047B]RKH13504.1 hypothetical protein D7X74_21820 [Corallococcus sp. CA047B]
MPTVRCSDCGASRLVGSDTNTGHPSSPHAARVASPTVRAAHPVPWPICQHGLGWLADCRERPVPPACCPLPSSIASDISEES